MSGAAHPGCAGRLAFIVSVIIGAGKLTPKEVISAGVLRKFVSQSGPDSKDMTPGHQPRTCFYANQKIYIT
jgi:hypothetical protein